MEGQNHSDSGTTKNLDDLKPPVTNEFLSDNIRFSKRKRLQYPKSGDDHKDDRKHSCLRRDELNYFFIKFQMLPIFFYLLMTMQKKKFYIIGEKFLALLEYSKHLPLNDREMIAKGSHQMALQTQFPRIQI